MDNKQGPEQRPNHTQPVPRTGKEHPSTYFIQDRSNLSEMERLEGQDRLFTQQMGGVLSEQADPTRFQHILDVGCATGGWLIEVAKTYPDIPLLIGVDISSTMVTYAREQAEVHHVSDRVQFHTMDALRMLEFPNEYFDLVNQRLGLGYLRTWDWPKLLQEYRRVSKPGGTIRITEVSSSHGSGRLAEYNQMAANVLHRAGHLPTEDANSLLEQLPVWMSRSLENVQSRLVEMEYRHGTPEHAFFLDDSRRLLPLSEAFVRKWERISKEDYQSLVQAVLAEMQEPGFSTIWLLKTVWGTV